MNKNKNTKPNANTVGTYDYVSKTKDIANVVGAGPMSARDRRGITLVALIITIIVMLILVAVSVTIAIKGDLFGTAKRAAKGTEKEKNLEQQLANGRVKIDETWYDSFEDYVAGKPSEDQNESKIKFSYEPKGWTNGPVKVKIEVQEIEGQLQYSTDGVTWTNYTEELEVKNSGTKIYARVMESEEETETVVNTIDKEAPNITTELSSPSQTTTSINVKIGVKDSVSGISKIEWYYKILSETEDKYTKLKEEDKYAEINGENAGNRNEIKAEKTISGLEKDTTYNIKVVIYDVAGNKTESIVEAQTTVKKYMNINGTRTLVNAKDAYGATVDGYTCDRSDVTWKLFYIDSEDNDRVYLIASEFMSTPVKSSTITDKMVQFLGSSIAYTFPTLDNYSGNLPNDAFAKKYLNGYNGKESTFNSLRQTNYLLNQSVWNEYNGPKADYAYGGPTIPLFVASFNDVSLTNVKLKYDIDYYGYSVAVGGGSLSTSCITGMEANFQNGIYFGGDNGGQTINGFWLASPLKGSSDSLGTAVEIRSY